MPCYITAILLVYTAMERHMCFTVVIVMYLLLLSFLLLVDDPVDPSCFWLIDVRPLVRVSAPGVYLLVALLLCTVNPSCLLHFRLLSPALCFSSIISPTAAVPYIACRRSSLIVVSRPLSPVSPTRTLQRWPVKWRGGQGLEH